MALDSDNPVPSEVVAPATTLTPAGLPMRVLAGSVTVVQYAVVVGLLILAVVVLVRSLLSFLVHPGQFPDSVVAGLDGILVVIIVLDILRTVLHHLEGAGFPVRPFLIIGILAAVRDILSASAHLTLDPQLSASNFDHNVIELGVSVGVVAVLLGGLAILRWTGPDPGADS